MKPRDLIMTKMPSWGFWVAAVILFIIVAVIIWFAVGAAFDLYSNLSNLFAEEYDLNFTGVVIIGIFAIWGIRIFIGWLFHTNEIVKRLEKIEELLNEKNNS